MKNIKILSTPGFALPFSVNVENDTKQVKEGKSSSIPLQINRPKIAISLLGFKKKFSPKQLNKKVHFNSNYCGFNLYGF